MKPSDKPVDMARHGALSPAHFKAVIACTGNIDNITARLDALVAKLTQDGVEVVKALDGRNKRNWLAVLTQAIQKVNFVVLICSSPNSRRTSPKAKSRLDPSSWTLFDLVDVDLVLALGKHVIPILLEGDSPDYIPAVLQKSAHFQLTARGYEDLYRHIAKLGYGAVVSRSTGPTVPLDEPTREYASEGGPQQTREITVTGHALDGAAVFRFIEGEIYRLHFCVSAPMAENLVSGYRAVEDIPKGGLYTRWVVTSTDVEFVAELSTPKVWRIGCTWLAEFDLLIPERGPSEVGKLAIVGGAPSSTLFATIYAVSREGKREVYRGVSVVLTERRATVQHDETFKAARHTHLRTTEEWTTPLEHVQVSILNGTAIVTTSRAHLKDHHFYESFDTSATQISGPINNIRCSLESFRQRQEEYLNNLDHEEIAVHLSRPQKWQLVNSSDGWKLPATDSTVPKRDPRFDSAFDEVQHTKEWKALASDGYALFDSCFRENTQLRQILTNLLPGSRIDFHWLPRGGDFVSHVPWALMYIEPPNREAPPDPEKFLGLRFRIGSRSWPVKNSSVTLGSPETTHLLHFMYRGDDETDETAGEAQWQRTEYNKWKHSRLVPDPTQPNPKHQILGALEAPGPSPVGLLYFYCHCTVGDGSDPALRFGNSLDDVVDRVELPRQPIPDAPIVFANACNTAQADPRMASYLEQAFLSRGARAFVGTETKVPIKLASKFAWLYFQFFCRIVDPNPIAAGEALTQARMFLWTQFKNVGGLFYSIANQYELYLASETEVQKLRD